MDKPTNVKFNKRRQTKIQNGKETKAERNERLRKYKLRLRDKKNRTMKEQMQFLSYMKKIGEVPTTPGG